MGTELFFDPDGEVRGRKLRRERAAKNICSTCPVLIECRDHALLSGECGIWGGTNAVDRRALRRKGSVVPRSVWVKGDDRPETAIDGLPRTSRGLI